MVVNVEQLINTLAVIAADNATDHCNQDDIDWNQRRLRSGLPTKVLSSCGEFAGYLIQEALEDVFPDLHATTVTSAHQTSSSHLYFILPGLCPGMSMPAEWFQDPKVPSFDPTAGQYFIPGAGVAGEMMIGNVWLGPRTDLIQVLHHPSTQLDPLGILVNSCHGDPGLIFNRVWGETNKPVYPAPTHAAVGFCSKIIR